MEGTGLFSKLVTGAAGSISPALVPHGKAIQRLAVESPVWHEHVHQGDEAAVVRGFEQVDHLQLDHVFEGGAWPGGMAIGA
jgi:hypothetical protein